MLGAASGAEGVRHSVAEVVAPLVVRRERLLHPGADAAQLACELLVLEADLRREAVAQPLRERRRRAGGRYGDGDVAAPVQGGQDEGAQLRDVLDVAEDPACARIREDALALLDVDDHDEPDVVEQLGLVPIDGDDLPAAGFERTNLALRAPDNETAAARHIGPDDVVLCAHMPPESSRAQALRG